MKITPLHSGEYQLKINEAEKQIIEDVLAAHLCRLQRSGQCPFVAHYVSMMIELLEDARSK